VTIAQHRAALAAWLRANPDATTRQIAAATGSTRRNLLTDLPAIGAVHRRRSPRGGRCRTAKPLRHDRHDVTTSAIRGQQPADDGV